MLNQRDGTDSVERYCTLVRFGGCLSRDSGSGLRSREAEVGIRILRKIFFFETVYIIV